MIPPMMRAGRRGKILLGLVVFLSYMLGPIQWRTAASFEMVNKVPGGVALFGWLVGAATLLVFIDDALDLGSRLLRIGFSCLVGLYGGFGLALLWACRPGGESHSGPVFGCLFLYLAWMCYQSAIDQPALTWKRQEDDGGRRN